MPRLSYYMGDLYPNLGSYNDTTAQTVPMPSDVAAMDQHNFDSVLTAQPDPNISANHVTNHYWGLLIIVATILLLGIRF